MTPASDQPPHRRGTRWVLGLVGADPRDVPGPLAHHHLMTFAFVVVNFVMAVGLTYSGLPQIAPDFGPGARAAMALFMGMVVFLLDLYVVSVRYRLPERDPSGPLERTVAFVIARSELLPRLLMTGLLVLGLGALLTFTVNGEEIDRIKDERAERRSRELIDKRVADEAGRLATAKAALTAAETALTAAQEALDDRRAEEADARDLRNCELHRVPPPSRAPGCTGQAGTGPAYERADEDWQTARATTQLALDARDTAADDRAAKRTDVDAQQATYDRARARAEADPDLAPEAVRVDGWSATRSAFDEATADQSWVARYWPEIAVFIIDVTPLMLMLFGGRQESQLNRERRLRRRRAEAALDDETALAVRRLDDESELARRRAETKTARAQFDAQAARAESAAASARADAEADLAVAQALREQRVADARQEAEHLAALATARREAERVRHAAQPGSEPADVLTEDLAPSHLAETPGGSRALDPQKASRPEPHREWTIRPLDPVDTATACWREGEEIRFAAGAYRLVTMISSSTGSDAYSSSDVWFAEAIGDRVLGAPVYCAVKAMHPGPRFDAESAFLNTVGLQPVGIPAHVGTVMHGDRWAVGYQYHPRTDAARYVFGTEQREPITVGLLLDWLHQALDGLHTLWYHGLLHNDVKLLNLLLTGSHGKPPDALAAVVEPLKKILVNDFDVVCRFDERESVTAQSWELCAPEVFEAGQRMTNPLPLSPRSDLYGLFAAVYQVATSGHHPRQSTPDHFAREHHADLATDLLTRFPAGSAAAPTIDPVPLPLPAAALAEGLPRRFSDLLQDGVHPDPQLRFRGAGEDFEALYAHAETAIRACRADLSDAELGFVVAHHGPIDGYPAPAGWPANLDSELSA